MDNPNCPVTEALRVLGLPAGSSLEVVNAAYRKLSIKHHPDKGGDNSVQATLNDAVALLRAELANGTEVIEVPSSSSSQRSSSLETLNSSSSEEEGLKCSKCNYRKDKTY
ncbi:Chaperone protein dnaJ A6 [Frankliniella fusca]|uniref:Chaperone protein dnaJ A6 n=1 Tax=Frankliniella fusca TaxID=407009 RepID=A0AAE1HHZ2_9NEOP|nr:Chaperone protein dnaJ A6 [Frankliniella fusca]